ncbi:MAG: serine/threonine protein kinase [bacterium]|nr:serine/threonine protein kinase [bacterium]
MSHPLIDVDHTDQKPEAFLQSTGHIFQVIDNGSGNLSYGVRVDQDRYFVKTAGDPDAVVHHQDLNARIKPLQTAIQIHTSYTHPSLPALHNVIESPDGPMLIYEWVDGECLGVGREHRDNPESAFQRFKHLPVEQILKALDTIYKIHLDLSALGWIAVDFYDGTLIYDFDRQKMHIMDLDLYHQGPFTNEMGRMFGSSRFMAPEEFQKGERIDECTNVFTMGRTAVVLLSLERTPFRGNDVLFSVIQRACAEKRSARFPSMQAFHTAWSEARSQAG